MCVEAVALLVAVVGAVASGAGIEIEIEFDPIRLVFSDEFLEEGKRPVACVGIAHMRIDRKWQCVVQK